MFSMTLLKRFAKIYMKRILVMSLTSIRFKIRLKNKT